MSRPWRLLLDSPGSAAANMAVDDALLLYARDQGPTLRLYSWRSPTVSVGLRQGEPLASTLLRRCAERGVELVRRVSGGGAVLHAGDLTYAVVSPSGSTEVPPDLPGSYGWIRSIVVAGLRRAGLPAEPARPLPGAERLSVCFAGSVGLEIELEGRKLVGSAQRRTAAAFLQHGSIRLRAASELQTAIFGSPGPAAAPIPEDCSRAGIARCLVGAFSEALQGRLTPGGLSPGEQRMACKYEQARRKWPLWTPVVSSRTHQCVADTLA